MILFNARALLLTLLISGMCDFSSNRAGVPFFASGAPTAGDGLLPTPPDECSEEAELDAGVEIFTTGDGSGSPIIKSFKSGASSVINVGPSSGSEP